MQLGLIADASERDAAIQKKNYLIRLSFKLGFADDSINSFEWENDIIREWYHQNSQIIWRIWFIYNVNEQLKMKQKNKMTISWYAIMYIRC